MASEPSPPAIPADPTAWTRRLADQLRTLSEMGEALTYRLLELEERLAAQEQRLAPLLEQRGGIEDSLAEEMDLRMGETEERLARIEAVLNGLDRPVGARRLQPIRPAGPSVRMAGSMPRHPGQEMDDREPADELDPFLEEGEQPFMDELPA